MSFLYRADGLLPTPIRPCRTPRSLRSNAHRVSGRMAETSPCRFGPGRHVTALEWVRSSPRSGRKANDLAFRATNARSHSGGPKDRTLNTQDKRSFDRPSSRSLTMPGSLRGAVSARRVSSSSASACRARSRQAVPRSAASGRQHRLKSRSTPSSQGRRDPRWRGQEDACA